MCRGRRTLLKRGCSIQHAHAARAKLRGRLIMPLEAVDLVRDFRRKLAHGAVPHLSGLSLWVLTGHHSNHP